MKTSHAITSATIMASCFLLGLPSADAQDLRVKSWKIIRGQANGNGEGLGGRLDWSVKRNLIAYDKIGSDGFYDLWTMNPDGSSDTCVTCNTPLGRFNVGSPRWSPDGRWILVVAQRSQLGNNNNGRPGVGVANDVWAIDYASFPASFKAYKLDDTSIYPAGGGALHPVFNHKGDKVFWVVRTNSEPTAGTWEMRLANFQVDSNGIASVTNVDTTIVAPGSQANFYESHNFSLDDTKLTFTANVGNTNELVQGGDVVILDLASRQWTNITNTPNIWDEHLHPIPGTSKYMWMTANQTYGYAPGTLRTEFWIADGDGTNKRKLTWFNDSRDTRRDGWFQFGGGVAGDLSFGPPLPTGELQVMVYVVLNGEGLGNTGVNILMTLEQCATSLNAASFYRPPLSADSYISIFSNTANLATQSALGQLTDGQYPTTLGGTSVTVTDAKGVGRLAQLVYVGPLGTTYPSQVNMIIPAGTAAGPADVSITNSNGEVTRETYTIESADPAIFAANTRGTGAASAYIQRSDDKPGQAPTYTFLYQNGTYSDNPISVTGADTYLILFGTGVRGANQASVVLTPVRGGSPVTLQPSYWKAQGQYPALDQVVVQLPSSLGGQNQQYNVVLTADGVSSNTITLTIN